MDRGAGVPKDAGQDLWDWEVLPDERTFSTGHGSVHLNGGAAEAEPVVQCKDIEVVPDESKPVLSVADPMACDKNEKEKVFQSPDDPTASDKNEEEKVFQSPDDPTASDKNEEEKVFQSPDDPMASEKNEEEKVLQSPDAKEADDEKFSKEEEDVKKDNNKARPECVVFCVGKLKVNGIGALCSFGVAAATVCIFLIGGRLQHHHRQQQQQKIQMQFYGDDKRIQQVVQQTSRLNQAMSSVMGAGGASARANISFGGFYDGF